jgi:hypothetical protein
MAHPGGRPRKKFDLKKVERLGRIGSSCMEMAALFDCATSTVTLLMNDEGSEFSKAYKKGLANTSDRIRSKQIKMAVNGVVPMSIWVGKNLLGQFDTPTTNVMVAQANGYPPRPGLPDLDPCSPVNRAKLLHLAELTKAIQDEALKQQEGEVKTKEIEVELVDDNTSGKGCEISVSSRSLRVLPSPPTAPG